MDAETTADLHELRLVLDRLRCGKAVVVGTQLCATVSQTFEALLTRFTTPLLTLMITQARSVQWRYGQFGLAALALMVQWLGLRPQDHFLWQVQVAEASFRAFIQRVKGAETTVEAGNSRVLMDIVLTSFELRLPGNRLGGLELPIVQSYLCSIPSRANDFCALHSRVALHGVNFPSAEQWIVVQGLLWRHPADFPSLEETKVCVYESVFSMQNLLGDDRTTASESELAEIVDTHSSAAVRLVIAQHYMEARVKLRLQQAGIRVLDGIGSQSIGLFARATGSTPLQRYTGLCAQVCGSARSLGKVKYGDDEFLLVASDRCASVLLYNFLKDEFAAITESFEQGFTVLGRTLLRGKVSRSPPPAGLGESEALIARTLGERTACSEDLCEALRQSGSLVCIALRTAAVASYQSSLH